MNDSDDAVVNQETWSSMVRFYEEDFLHRAHWQYLAPLYRLVKDIAASDRAKRFRAGNSLVTLIISTTSYHGLQENDLWVSIDMRRPENNEAPVFELKYQRGYTHHIEKRRCGEEDVLTVLDEFLNRLWHDTKGN